MKSRIRIDVKNRSDNMVSQFYIDEHVFEQLRPALDQSHEEEILKQICQSDFAINKSETIQYIHRIRKTPNASNSSYTLLKLTSTSIQAEHSVNIHNYNNYETVIYRDVLETEIKDFSPLIKQSETEFLKKFIDNSDNDYFSGKISVKKPIETPVKRVFDKEDANELYTLALSTFEISDGKYTQEIKKINKWIQRYQEVLIQLETTITYNLQLVETYHLDRIDFSDDLQKILAERKRIEQISEHIKDPRNPLITQSKNYHQTLEELNFLKKMFAVKIYEGIEHYFELIHQKGSAITSKRNSKGEAKAKIYSKALSRDLDEFNSRLAPINIRISQLKIDPIDNLYRHFVSQDMTLQEIAKAISRVLTNCQSTESKAFQKICDAIKNFNACIIIPKCEYITDASKKDAPPQTIKKCSVTSTTTFKEGFRATFEWHTNILEFEKDVKTKCDLIKKNMKNDFTETLFEGLKPLIDFKAIQQQVNRSLQASLLQVKAKKFSEFKQFIEQTFASLLVLEKEATTEVHSIAMENTELPERIKFLYGQISSAKNKIEEKIKLVETLEKQFEQEVIQPEINKEILKNLLEKDLKDICAGITSIINTTETNLRELTDLIVQKRTELLKQQKEDENSNYASEVELAQSIRHLNRESMRQSVKPDTSDQQKILPKITPTQRIKTKSEIEQEKYNERILGLCREFVAVVQDEVWKKQVRYKYLVKSPNLNPDNGKQPKLPCGFNKMTTEIKIHKNWEDNPKPLLKNILIIIFDRMRVSQHNIKYFFWKIRRSATTNFYRGTLLIIGVDFKQNKKILKIKPKDLEEMIENIVNSLSDKQITDLIHHLEKFRSETMRPQAIK